MDITSVENRNFHCNYTLRKNYDSISEKIEKKNRSMRQLTVRKDRKNGIFFNKKPLKRLIFPTKY